MLNARREEANMSESALSMPTAHTKMLSKRARPANLPLQPQSHFESAGHASTSSEHLRSSGIMRSSRSGGGGGGGGGGGIPGASKDAMSIGKRVLGTRVLTRLLLTTVLAGKMRQSWITSKRIG